MSTTDVVIAADVTGSMGVADATYGDRTQISRLDAAKAAIDDITAAYAHSSFAAVSFGASGTQDVPLTPDARAIDNWADSLRVERPRSRRRSCSPRGSWSSSRCSA